jgi:hypothetical protein
MVTSPSPDGSLLSDVGSDTNELTLDGCRTLVMLWLAHRKRWSRNRRGHDSHFEDMAEADLQQSVPSVPLGQIDLFFDTRRTYC